MSLVKFTLFDHHGMPVANLEWDRHRYELLKEFLNSRASQITAYSEWYVVEGQAAPFADPDLIRELDKWEKATAASREAKKKKAEENRINRLLKAKKELEEAGLL